MKETSDPANTLVVADNREAAALGVQLVRDGQAYGIVYVDEDLRSGVLIVRYAVGPGNEHRLPELEALVASCSASLGATKVDIGRFVSERGQA